MIEEQGRVIALESGYALVQTQRKSSCGGCSVHKGCGTNVIAKLIGQRITEVRAVDPIGVNPGDEVIIGVEEAALVQGSLAVYTVPLVLMLVLAGIAQWQWGYLGDWPAVVAGITGIGIGFIWLSIFARSVRLDERFQPVILRRIHLLHADVSVPNRAQEE